MIEKNKVVSSTAAAPAEKNDKKSKQIHEKEKPASENKKSQEKSEKIKVDEKQKNDRLEKIRLEKVKAADDLERKNNISKLTAEIDALKNNEKVVDQIEKTEFSNRSIYDQQSMQLSHINSASLILQNDKSYQDAKDGTDKLKDVIKDTNSTIVEKQYLIKKENDNVKEESAKEIKKENIPTANSNSVEIKPVAVKVDNIVKKDETVSEKSEKLVKSVSDSMKKNDKATEMIQENIKGNMISQKINYNWKMQSFYIVSGFSLITLLFMSFIGFNKKEED